MSSAGRAGGGPTRGRASRRASPTGRAHAVGASRFAPAAGRIRALALLAQLVEHLHGKEGGDGSSPSEGLKKPLQISGSRLALVARTGDEGRTKVALGSDRSKVRGDPLFDKERVTPRDVDPFAERRADN